MNSIALSTWRPRGSVPLCTARGLAAAATFVCFEAGGSGVFSMGAGAARAGDFALARFDGVFFAGGGEGDGDRYAAGDAWARRVERGGILLPLSIGSRLRG